MDDAGHTLRGKVKALRRLVRLAMATVGIGRLLCAVAALVLIDYALDRAFRLPRGTRLVLLCVGGAGMVWQLARQLLAPLVRVLPDQALALEMEHRWRGPADLLASALHFTSAPAGGRASASLESATVLQAQRLVEGLAPAHLIAWPRVRRWFLLGGIAAAVLAALAAQGPASAALWFRRNVVLARVDWPRRTQLVLLELPPFVPRGEDVEIRVKALGVVPRAARLEVRGVTSRASQTLQMERTGEAVFSAKLVGVAETMAFTVKAGDGMLDEQRLEVVDRPAVSAARMIVTPPDYIARTLAAIVREGGMELAWNAPAFEIPRGSRVEVVLEATKPLSSAWCRLDGADPIEARRRRADSVSFALAVDRDLTCEFGLVDTYGIESREPLRVELRAIPDEPPEVRVAATGVGGMLVPEARVPLVVRARDDHGLESVWLNRWHQGADGRTEYAPVRLLEGQGQAGFDGSYVEDLRERALPPGGRFVVSVGARDNCPPQVDPGPNSATSAPLSFRLVTVQELLWALLLRQEDLRRDLEQQIQRQKDIREGLAGRVGGDGELDDLERMQRALAGVLGLTGDGYRAVLDQMLNNRTVSQSNYELRIAGIVHPLAALAGADGAVVRAADALAQVRRLEPPAESGGPGLAQPVRLMDEAVAEMEEVRSQMMLLESYAALLASVQEMADQQRELLRRTQEEQRRMFDAFWGE